MADDGEKAKKARTTGALVLTWTRRLLLVLIAFAGLGMIAVALIIRHYEEGLPSTEELKRYQPKQVSRILARDGTLLAEDFTERRTIVHISEIPPHVQLAFLAAEDASFYEHQGLNYLAMLRAVWVNLRGGSKQGASTITQQVVKNVLLTNERTYKRKIEEIILSRKIEQELSKDDILELYLNYIYFGHGRYGIEEASKYYFGKSVGELTLAEAAILASIPKGPSIYSPRDHMDKAKARQGDVLTQMLQKGFAPAEAVAAAREEKIVLAPEPDAVSELAPEAVNEARKELREIVGSAADEGGYTVTTTIVPKLQIAAKKAVRENLEAYDKRWGLEAPIKKPKRPAQSTGSSSRGPSQFFEGDPVPDEFKVYVGEVVGADDAKGVVRVRVGNAEGTLSVDALQRYNPAKLPPSKFAEVGAPLRVSILSAGPLDKYGHSKDMVLRPEMGPEGALVAIDVASRDIVAMVGSYEGMRSGLDRASHAHRQPGSTFKTFTYSYALHSKSFTPATLVPTSPSALGDAKHTPKNYDKSEDGDPVRLREALAQSVNVSAEWTAIAVGPQHIVDWAKDAGIESKLGATPSIALGAYEVTPRELANAYTTFADGGLEEPARLVTKIVAPDGTEVPLPPRAPKHASMSDAEAFMTIDLLRSVVDHGTGTAAKALRRPIAGKTGTSNDVKDAWFAGFSTQTTCVVWTGFDDNVPLGAGEAGARTSLPAFVDFMRAAHDGVPATEFPVPSGITRASIDPKTGLLARPDQDDGISDVFLSGTEPTETAPAPDASPTAPSASPPAPSSNVPPPTEKTNAAPDGLTAHD